MNVYFSAREFELVGFFLFDWFFSLVGFFDWLVSWFGLGFFAFLI